MWQQISPIWNPSNLLQKGCADGAKEGGERRDEGQGGMKAQSPAEGQEIIHSSKSQNKHQELVFHTPAKSICTWQALHRTSDSRICFVWLAETGQRRAVLCLISILCENNIILITAHSCWRAGCIYATSFFNTDENKIRKHVHTNQQGRLGFYSVHVLDRWAFLNALHFPSPQLLQPKCPENYWVFFYLCWALPSPHKNSTQNPMSRPDSRAENSPCFL